MNLHEDRGPDSEEEEGFEFFGNKRSRNGTNGKRNRNVGNNCNVYCSTNYKNVGNTNNQFSCVLNANRVTASWSGNLQCEDGN